MKTILFLCVLVVGCTCAHKPVANNNTVSSPIDMHGQSVTLEGQYWKLAEINNRKFPVASESAKETYIIMRSADHRVSGNGGCNSFNGKYTAEGQHIRFSDFMATKMACGNLPEELTFFTALKEACYYSIVEDTLILKDREAAIHLKFKASDMSK
jgi:heat shock protein HslJ